MGEERVGVEGSVTKDVLLAETLRTLEMFLVCYDSEYRLLHASQGVRDYLEMPSDSLPPGTTLAEVTRLLAYHGFYGAGDPERQWAQAMALDRKKPFRRLVRDTRGHYLDLMSLPVAGGGLVIYGDSVSGYMAATRAAEARATMLDAVLRRLDTGVALFDADQAILMHNPAHDRLVGAPSGLVTEGMKRPALLQGLQQAGEFVMDPNMLGELVALNHANRLDFTHRRPNGEVIRLRSVPLEGGGFQVEILDITVAQMAEDEAQRRAGLMDGILEALPVGVCVYGPDRRITKINGTMNEIMRGAEMQVGEHLHEIIARRYADGEFVGETEEDMRERQRRFEAGAHYSHIRTRPDGTVVSIRRAKLPDGGQVTVVSDVTALKQAERSASERAETLQVMLDNLRQGICLVDDSGLVIAANQPAQLLTGLGDALRPGAHMHDLTTRQFSLGEFDGDLTIKASFEQFAAQGTIPRHRYTRTRRDGTVVDVLTEAVPGGFLRVYDDVTEERRIRRELEEAKDAAEAANTAKSRFLATMSHELRTPLNAVIGFSEALRAELASTGAPHDYATAIEEAGRRLLSMIDSILEVSGAESGMPAGAEPFDLGSALRGLLRGAVTEAEEKGLVAQLSMPATGARLKMDARRFHRVVEALLSNAVKFTPPGGLVTLGAAPAAEGGWEVWVTDTGIGIAAEDIPRAFEPFTQLETTHARQHAGTGMGLYLARTLAEAMGCGMYMKSTPGQGTTVALSIPAARLS